MAKEKLNTEVRREQIADAALRVVSEKGLKGLSIAAVAGRIGLVPSAIYRHFKSKEAVLDACIDLIGERLEGNLAAVSGPDPAPERLKALLDRHVRLIRDNRAIPRIIFSEDVYGGRPARQKRVGAIVRRYLAGVADIVRQGQREGSIARGLDADTVSLLFLGIIQPAGILWHLSGGRFDVAGHAERAWAIFYRAIAP